MVRSALDGCIPHQRAVGVSVAFWDVTRRSRWRSGSGIGGRYAGTDSRMRLGGESLGLRSHSEPKGVGCRQVVAKAVNLVVRRSSVENTDKASDEELDEESDVELEEESDELEESIYQHRERRSLMKRQRSQVRLKRGAILCA